MATVCESAMRLSWISNRFQTETRTRAAYSTATHGFDVRTPMKLLTNPARREKRCDWRSFVLTRSMADIVRVDARGLARTHRFGPGAGAPWATGRRPSFVGCCRSAPHVSSASARHSTIAADEARFIMDVPSFCPAHRTGGPARRSNAASAQSRFALYVVGDAEDAPPVQLIGPPRARFKRTLWVLPRRTRKRRRDR
jgi:hypothetical protein